MKDWEKLVILLSVIFAVRKKRRWWLSSFFSLFDCMSLFSRLHSKTYHPLLRCMVMTFSFFARYDYEKTKPLYSSAFSPYYFCFLHAHYTYMFTLIQNTSYPALRPDSLPSSLPRSSCHGALEMG